jgi:hypothetical protein
MSIDDDQHLSDLKNAILRAFPDVVFEGKLTRHDGAWLPECGPAILSVPALCGLFFAFLRVSAPPW